MNRELVELVALTKKQLEHMMNIVEKFSNDIAMPCKLHKYLLRSHYN